MADLTAPPVTTPSMDEQQAPRFQRDEQATILITAAVDSEWDACAPGGETHLMLGVRLPDGRYVIVPADGPGVQVIHGDITPALTQMAADAIAYHDEGGCGDREHEELVCQYERLADNAGLQLPEAGPILTAAPAPPNPG